MSDSVSFRMPGAQPTVEMPVRRWVMPRSGSRRAAAEHGVEVHHRLAHAHEHEVVERLDAAEVQHLVEDLRRGQVAPEPHRAGRAERARQRAARLRGDADRAAAVAVAHQHRLDRAPVVGLEQRLDRAVARVRLVQERQRRVRDLGLQALAQRRRQVGHRVVAGGAARGPAPRLAGAEGGLAGVGERALEQLEIHRRLWWQGHAPRQAPRPRRGGLAPRRRAARVRRARHGRRRGRARPRARRDRARRDRRRPQARRRAGGAARGLPRQQARRRRLDRARHPRPAHDRRPRQGRPAPVPGRAGSTPTRPA